MTISSVSRIAATSTFALGALVAAALPASAFAASASTTSGTYHVMIMTHLCNSSIKDWNDFQAMESGRDPITNIAKDVLACPTTGLSASTPVAGAIASPRTMFDFSVKSDTETKTLAANGTFMPTKICESDVHLDLDGDGQMSTSTCLDISDYDIPVSAGPSTILKVTQTTPPAGYHMGVLRWTPVALDGNNDSEDLSYINTQHNRIDLNMVPDKDNMVMLHVYEFQNSTSTNGMGNDGMGSSTPPGNNGNTSAIQALIAQFQMLQQELQQLLGQGTGSTGAGGAGGSTGGTMTGSTTGMISPASITTSAGGGISFGGSQFMHEENVAVSLNGTTVATAHADGGGNFSTGSLNAPTTPGTYTYTFTGAGGDSASATVMVH